MYNFNGWQADKQGGITGPDGKSYTMDDLRAWMNTQGDMQTQKAQGTSWFNNNQGPGQGAGRYGMQDPRMNPSIMQNWNQPGLMSAPGQAFTSPQAPPQAPAPQQQQMPDWMRGQYYASNPIQDGSGGVGGRLPNPRTPYQSNPMDIYGSLMST